MAMGLLWLVMTLLGAGVAAFAAAQDGPDAAAHGSAEGYPVGRRGTINQLPYMVGSYSHFDQIGDHHRVERPPAASPLNRAASPLTLGYSYQGAERDLDDYLARHPATGFLIARGDTILYERYRYARTDRDRFLSQSMAKTVTGMLVGVAVAEGRIRSIDDPAETYVPGLAGSAYGATPIRALLQMASGIAFSEEYNGHDDIARMGRDLFRTGGPGPVAVVRQFDRREVPPRTRFHYAGVESEVLGLVLRGATGMSLADYLGQRIWQPMGAEADAVWAVDSSGQEAAYCCFSAVLRDYARFALLLAHDGVAAGRQIIPRQWLLQATTVAPADGFLAPRTAAPFFGYGYQTWIFPGPRRMFALLGVHGQAIYVDPALQLVLVHTAVRQLPAKDPAAAELGALWRALVRQQGG
jgi:CubicO group peptidase (beta-lactamase class C family)